VLTKSRGWSGESSGGARGLDDQAIEDDTCRESRGGIVDTLLQAVGGLGLKTTGRRFLGLGLKTQVRFRRE
jgi:hypothetical protein